MTKDDPKGAVRGASWWPKEVLELLAHWGDARVQMVLKHSNFECFEKIAEGMTQRGFPCTALECRTKTKAMRLQYNKSFTHNLRSSEKPKFCPYYAQVHQILKEDACKCHTIPHCRQHSN